MKGGMQGGEKIKSKQLLLRQKQVAEQITGGVFDASEKPQLSHLPYMSVRMCPVLTSAPTTCFACWAVPGKACMPCKSTDG